VGLSPSQVDIVSRLFAGFLAAKRDRYYSLGLPLNDEQRGELSGFFRADLMEVARIHTVHEPLHDPDFFPLLEKMGIGNLPSFLEIQATTFEKVIVFVGPMAKKLLFHEMVHAEQFRQLGIAGFARHYVEGFLSTGAYEAIPLEIQAYGLGAHYETAPRRRFSVEEEVSRWMTEGKF
jgi:hypothetical protein